MEKKSELIDKAVFSEFFKHIKENFDSMKNELDEHRESINDNAAEIGESFNALAEFDERLQKIDERVAELQMLMKQLVENNTAPKANYILSKYEQKIFTLLYTEEDNALTVSDIAIRLDLSELIVKAALSSLVKKGIPILKAQINQKTYLKLDAEFKELQAKENILNLSHRKESAKDGRITSFF